MIKRFSFILSTGFAMFSMFFGSGNLIFPVLVGQVSQGQYYHGALGIFLSGILVPFLGCLTLILYEGDWRAFFKQMGNKLGLILPLFLLMILGPLGVCARCISVAYGSIKQISPSFSMHLFSGLFCLSMYGAVYSKGRLINLIGSYLTPLLLIGLAILGYLGLSQMPAIEAKPLSEWQAFNFAFLQGYQTMDLLAAFFFSSYIVQYVRKHNGNSSLLPCLLGMLMLASVYLLLLLLGSRFSTFLEHTAPSMLLGKIAQLVMGEEGSYLFALIVILACFTTAVVLITLFADFLHQEVIGEKFPYHPLLILSLILCFLTSSLDFDGIARLLIPPLEVLYPSLIILTLLSFIHKLYGIKLYKWPFYLALILQLSTKILL